MPSDAYIIVLGAGVIGLQTAISLSRKNVKVTIVSKSWPGDIDPYYTSAWSGAQWRSTDDLHDFRQQEWERETFEHFNELVQQYSATELGIELKPALYYWDDLTEEARQPAAAKWWSNVVPDFKVLPKSRLLSEGGFAAGISYKTFAISPTIYIQFLLRICISLGVECRSMNVKALHELFSEPDLSHYHGVVNCAGLGAGELASDKCCFPTKGQTILVKGKAEYLATRKGKDWEALIIPRPGENVTLLGGCKIAGDWSTQADPKMTQTILKRCKPLARSLLNSEGEFDIEVVQVGIRSSRIGGPRIELEILPISKNLQVEKFVCHNYGHHSAGFESSVGVANKAVELILSHLKRH